MNARGWIPAHRSLFDRADWLCPTKKHPAGKREAWLDLCQMAQYEEYDHAGERLQRGEFLASVRSFAERWKWSKSQVGRFLNRLEIASMIGTVRGTPRGTVYLVTNYDTYAIAGSGKRDTQRDTMRDTSGTDAGQEEQRTKNKPTSTEGAGAKKKSRKKPQIEMPDGWSPNATHRERAIAHEIDIELQVALFTNHHDSHGNRFASWDSAFTTWLIRAPEFTNGKPDKTEDLSHWDNPT